MYREEYIELFSDVLTVRAAEVIRDPNNCWKEILSFVRKNLPWRNYVHLFTPELAYRWMRLYPEDGIKFKDPWVVVDLAITYPRERHILREFVTRQIDAHHWLRYYPLDRAYFIEKGLID